MTSRATPENTPTLTPTPPTSPCHPQGESKGHTQTKRALLNATTLLALLL